MKTLTLWQRIINDTPAFFKRAQIFGLGLISLAISLSEIGVLSERITTALTSAGATMAAISQFAVKQYQPLNDHADESK